MICMVMFGNGIMIGMPSLTAAAHKSTPMVILQARTACFAVVAGAPAKGLRLQRPPPQNSSGTRNRFI